MLGLSLWGAGWGEVPRSHWPAALVPPGEALRPQAGLAHGSPPGLAYICEGLKEQKKGLETLVLWNNQLTHTGMAFLGMTLVSGTRERGGRPRVRRHLSAPSSSPIRRLPQFRKPCRSAFRAV